MRKEIRKDLKDLGFKSKEIKVYLALTELGESPAAKISKKIDLPRTTVIGVLERLQQKGYLSAHWYKGNKHYWIESPKTIEEILLNRVKIARDLSGLLEDLYRTEADFPRSEVYDTRSGVKNFIEKTVAGLEKNTIIYTIDTPSMGHYRRIFSGNFGDSLLRMKNKKGVVTQSLVPRGSYKKIDKAKLDGQSIYIREMPEEIIFESSVWIIGDTLVHFSGKYPFIVAIKHKLIARSFKSIYDYLWQIAEKKYPE